MEFSSENLFLGRNFAMRNNERIQKCLLTQVTIILEALKNSDTRFYNIEIGSAF